MRLKHVLVTLACALVLGPATICAQPVPPATTPGIAAKLIIRGDLQGLQVFDLRSQVRNDVIVAQAELYNSGDRDARLYYRFRWVDSGGMQVGDGETWKPLVFLGRQSQYIKGTAPGPKAADFYIEMSAEPR
jgi:hypothetical protein